MNLVDMTTLRGLDAHVNHLTEVEGRLREIDAEAGGQPLDTERQAEWEELDERRAAVKASITQLEARQRYIAEMAQSEGNVERPREREMPNVARSRLPENLHDLFEYRNRTPTNEATNALMRDGAKKVAEQSSFHFERVSREECVDGVHKLLDRDRDGIVARRVLATGSELYKRSFAKLVTGFPVAALSGEEQRAIATVGASQLGDGGYALPFTLDATVVLTNSGAVSDLRRIARVEQLISGNEWRGLTSAGITVTRGPAEETAISTDSSPTFSQPTVTVQPVKALAKVSIEATEDWPRVFDELGIEFMDAKNREEASAFVTGDGNDPNPGGIVGSLDPSSYVATADTSSPISLALADVFTLKKTLPVRFRENASYLANDAIYDLVRQFSVGTVGDGSVWTYGIEGGRPDRLLGRPAHEASAMADDMTEAGLVLVYGDFRYFLIVDKVGMSIELIPHLFNGEGQPTGQRGVYMHYRNSSVILADEAFRALHSGTIAS